MPDTGEPGKPDSITPAKQALDSLPELIRRALVQAAELREIEERTKALSERIQKLLAPPEKPTGKQPPGTKP